MPVIFNDNKPDNYNLGIWMIEEDYETLFTMINLNGDDCGTLSNFTNISRKVEWLSVRVLLKELIKKDTGIYYNNRRKPFLCDNSMNISISHSHNVSSILLSRDHRVGIDLEYMSHRISKIAPKFMHPGEYITPVKKLQRFHLYIHWCAKEALYKICDKNNIIFNKNLKIEPFEPYDNGVLTGNVIHDEQQEEFKLNYFKFENYIVVWCIK